MTPEEELRRAGKAKEILENELFKEAVSEIEESLKQARIQSGATDTKLREKLYAQEVALYSILRKLETHIETGQMAEQTLMQKAKAFFQPAGD